MDQYSPNADTQIEPSLSEVVAQSVQLAGIGRWKGFAAGQFDMASRQRIPALVGTMEIPPTSAPARLPWLAGTRNASAGCRWTANL